MDPRAGSAPADRAAAARGIAAALSHPDRVDATLKATTPDRVIEALEEAREGYRAAAPGAGARDARESLLHVLDAGRRPVFLRRISGTPLAGRWLAAVLQAIDAADVGLADLLRLRAAQAPDRPLFLLVEGRGVREITRREVCERVERIAAGLIRALPRKPGRVPVAILSPNRLETILTDLACLTHGIPNVPIAADATPDQVRFILEQTGPDLFVVSDLRRLEGVLAAGPLPAIRRVILMDPPEDGRDEGGMTLLSEIEEDGRAHGPAQPRRVHSRDLATIMFTSGTTGRPKGIRFSHRDVIFKRFCRAVALPEIGEDDRFLCYLPLFHTFGRWLEMTGCIFWGACYIAMENSSVEAMLSSMQRLRPSVFISIPKRWAQLEEKIVQATGQTVEDPFELDPAKVRAAVASVTGGALRWGLSAAGHLDSDVFLFFQRNGVELLSGFGMTEATGGITMTPPGRYRRGTVGVALPGIDARRAEDGELLVRGPYMMLGYDDPDEPERDYETEWFATGDLVVQDQDGYFTIVDRKKDIYKNVKGQTIAPQKIENMFNEFEEIKRTFLVGDGREYNTLLIYPDYDAARGKLLRMSPEELREYLSSFVVSVNRFLAPYERVVDFDLLPRYFREDKGELTPKGTFVRKIVERNFQDVIDALYARTYVAVDVQGIEVRVPAWLLREKGLTSDALAAEPGGIRLRPTGERVAISRAGTGPGRVRVGSYIYVIESPARPGTQPLVVDLDPLLRVPRLWVGNVELGRFAGESLLRRRGKGGAPPQRTRVEGWQRASLLVLDEIRSRFASGRKLGERGPWAVHCAVSFLFGTQGDEVAAALDALGEFLEDPADEDAVLARHVLPLLRFHGNPGVRRRALAMLLRREVDAGAAATLRRFLDVDPDLLTPELTTEILEVEMPAAATRSFLDFVQEAEAGTDPWTQPTGRRRVASLLRLAAEIAARQPRFYAMARQILARRAVPERDGGTRGADLSGVVAVATVERHRLDARFRAWIDAGIGEPAEPATGDPLPWDQIVGFDERIEESLRARLIEALRTTALLRESVFLLSEGTLLSAGDLLPGGIWVNYLGAGHNKTVVRIAVRTRSRRLYDFVVKLATDTPAAELAEEADWMIRLGSPERGVRLVPDFGGLWPEHALWSEEFVSGETVLAHIQRMTARGDPERTQRLVALWPHIAWSAMTAFVEFWQRTGRKIVISEPSPNNIVVAPHDYQEGSRLVSVSSRMTFSGTARMIRFLHEGFVEATERVIPALRGIVPRRIAFAGVMEALGEQAAIPLLWRALAEMREAQAVGGDPSWRVWHDELAAYIDEIERDGFAPRRLVMAVRRYHTWAGLNPGAALQARAMMLQELYETYGLSGLEPGHPELRVRFFRLTVFANARGPLATELDALIRGHRDAPLTVEALLRRMTLLHQSFRLDEEETYFLARMTYSHLTPAQRVRLELLEEGGETKAELVEEIRDEEDAVLKIRAAATPKEVMRLHRHFEQSGLSVVFRPEHRFLVVLDDQEIVAGGLFYRAAEQGTVHMEKIVVSPRHRGKGIGEKVMESFMQRMRDAGQIRVTTGFFQPHYFYQFGFRLERGFAGLVKDLRERTGPESAPRAAD